MPSTEKKTIIGRAVARIRDRYRDTRLKNGDISQRDYLLILKVLDEVKKETNKIYASF